MNREEFLNILKEENVEFTLDGDVDVRIRTEAVLYKEKNGVVNAYIIPDESFIKVGFFQGTGKPIPLSKVTREDVMKMVEAYRKTAM